MGDVQRDFVCVSVWGYLLCEQDTAKTITCQTHTLNVLLNLTTGVRSQQSVSKCWAGCVCLLFSYNDNDNEKYFI